VATVNRMFLSWSGPGSLPPGGSQGWWMVGFKYGDSLSVTAHPVTGNPTALHRVLAVDNIRVDGTPNGLTLRFTVRNVGSLSIPAYGIGISYIGA
jgi:hypothetical protein